MKQDIKSKTKNETKHLICGLIRFKNSVCLIGGNIVSAEKKDW